MAALQDRTDDIRGEEGKTRQAIQLAIPRQCIAVGEQLQPGGLRAGEQRDERRVDLGWTILLRTQYELEIMPAPIGLRRNGDGDMYAIVLGRRRRLASAAPA